MSEVHPTVSYRDIPEFPGYRVGDDGSVWCNLSRNGKGQSGLKWRRLTPHPNPSGHLNVGMSCNGKRSTLLVHRIVLTAFVGPCPDGMEACHYPDRNPANCHLANLRWDTHKANMRDMVEHGNSIRGERHPQSFLTENDVREIRKLYSTGAFIQRDLAERFGVHVQTIFSITSRLTWSHLAE